MQFSDPRKMNILLALENPYDLKAFSDVIAANNLSLVGTELEYAQKVGMVLYAINKFRDKPPLEAYMLLINGVETIKVDQLIGLIPEGGGRPSNCCGGGQVR